MPDRLHKGYKYVNILFALFNPGGKKEKDLEDKDFLPLVISNTLTIINNLLH